MIGTIIGNYRVTKLLGKGGMGAVYEAEHMHINRRVALKLLLPQFVETPDIVKRFVNEALAVNSISHPGIVQVSDQGRTQDGGLYMVMELLAGETLGERSKRHGGRLGESFVVQIGSQIASALAVAHENQIIHRDIKPSNIMLVPDSSAPTGERVKILDFGIAKVHAAGPHTKTGQMIGTAAFMSPEQIRGSSAIDGRSDVYSLGVLLYLLLAGSPPFPPAQSDIERVTQHILDAPIPLAEAAPDASAAVVRLVMQMLGKSAAERPAMAEVAAVLQSLAATSDERQTAVVKAPPATLAEGEPSTRGTLWPESATRPIDSSLAKGRDAAILRKRAATVVAAITIVAILIACGFMLWRHGDSAPPVVMPLRTTPLDRAPAQSEPNSMVTPVRELSSATRPAALPSPGDSGPVPEPTRRAERRERAVKPQNSTPARSRVLPPVQHGKTANSTLLKLNTGSSLSPKMSNGKTTSTPIIR